MRLRLLLVVATALTLVAGCAPGAGGTFSSGGGGAFSAALQSSRLAAQGRKMERERLLGLQHQPTCERWDWQFLSTAAPTEVAGCLAAGAEVNGRDAEYGMSPLHDAAAYNPNPDVIWTLVRAGALVNARDNSGATPLHHAAWLSDSPDVIAALVAAGGLVNVREAEHGATPLHWAAGWSDSPAVLVALLEAGADAGTRDTYGQTPWDLIQDNEALRGTDAYWRLNEGRFR